MNLSSSSTGTKVFASSLNGASVNFVNIPSGASSVNVYYGDTKAGSPVITGSGSLTSATQTETIVGGTASKFVITSTPVSGTASGSANVGPITVQEQDVNGNPASAPAGGTTVNLSSSSVGTKVFASSLGGAPVTSVTILVGGSTASFYYGDTQAGSPVVSASGSLTTATQTETIVAGAARSS